MSIDFILAGSLLGGCIIPICGMIMGTYQLNRQLIIETQIEQTLDCLEETCTNFMSILPIPDSDRDGISSIVKTMISSDQLRSSLKGDQRNPKSVSDQILQASQSFFSPDELSYIHRKLSVLTPKTTAAEMLSQINNLKTE